MTNGNFVDPPTMKEAEALAEELGTSIPGTIAQIMWALPILKKLLERIEELEEQVDDYIHGADAEEDLREA